MTSELEKKYQQKYSVQHWAAKRRGIEWHFTYASWRQWWGDDIVNRGNKKGMLVMARHDDIGPYHPDNVRKAKQEENAYEGQIGKPKSEEHKNNISKTKRNLLK